MTEIGTSITIHRARFTAPEVEEITGVPQVVIRDWRRRKLLGRLQTEMVGRRGAYTAFDLGYLTVLHDLTSKGMAIGQALIAADVAAPLVESYAEFATSKGPDATFVGLHGSRLARYVIVAGDGEIVRAGSLGDWETFRDKEGKSASGIVIDCKALGEQIAGKAPRPVVSVERSAP
ncbi:MerR family transcriptional regulator [Ancylobacter sp. SL191]|uniref:MerR family transcriptional regulator n=1 Tax=Ancylobacter sp. SL191 TaxID=2995166 RepID=UPI00227017AA|nr:MerR family transcriptional regulator [Ancylobacter sp. SL191]WAC27510.1 MerR family transcriptional regulator [Ancylobacter sp. SL191]